jgi:hypothetical protein
VQPNRYLCAVVQGIVESSLSAANRSEWKATFFRRRAFNTGTEFGTRNYFADGSEARDIGHEVSRVDEAVHSGQRVFSFKACECGLFVRLAEHVRDSYCRPANADIPWLIVRHGRRGFPCYGQYGAKADSRQHGPASNDFWSGNLPAV